MSLVSLNTAGGHAQGGGYAMGKTQCQTDLDRICYLQTDIPFGLDGTQHLQRIYYKLDLDLDRPKCCRSRRFRPTTVPQPNLESGYSGDLGELAGSPRLGCFKSSPKEGQVS